MRSRLGALLPRHRQDRIPENKIHTQERTARESGGPIMGLHPLISDFILAPELRPRPRSCAVRPVGMSASTVQASPTAAGEDVSWPARSVFVADASSAITNDRRTGGRSTTEGTAEIEARRNAVLPRRRQGAAKSG